VFCASLADVFDNAVPEQWRADLFRLIAQTPNLDWLLLTKRIGNAEKMMRESCGFYEPNPGCYTPWSNVWLGATISSQKEADRDIPKLLHVPAAKRFLSMEPLLGPVDLTRVVYPTLKRKDENDPYVAYDTLRGHMIGPDDVGLPKLDWVVVGGESGPKARLMRPDWVRSLRDQCVAAGVPFFFKQWGEFWHADAGEPPVECECFCLSDICNCYWHVGKKAAGRVLDDRVWDETPGEKQ
jgi:protein gp37